MTGKSSKESRKKIRATQQFWQILYCTEHRQLEKKIYFVYKQNKLQTAV